MMECYQAEGTLGDQHQEDWTSLLARAKEILTDPQVRSAYPALHRRPLRLRPMMEERADGVVGSYEPRSHRVKLWWNGRDYLTLLHELAHAATPGEGHNVRWQEAFTYLVWRFMGQEMGLRLTAAFLNHRLLRKEA